MKKMFELRRMLVIILIAAGALGVTKSAAQARVSLQVFYDELQPYGTWMDYGTHGYVWVPRVEPGFMPYATNGHWVYTEYGNTWVSNYSWGWAPFHYGRWLYDDFYGWIWVPDTEWGPAWVAWRSGGGYYGWAPLMPGISIHLTFNHYDRIPHRYWNFVPYQYVTYRHVHRHCVPHTRVVNVYKHTTIINNHYADNGNPRYFSGPSRSEIEKRGGGRVTVHSVNDVDRPGRTEVSRSTVNVYRPQVDNSRESRSRAIPASYVKRSSDGKMEEVVNRTRPSTTGSKSAEVINREDASRYNSSRIERDRSQFSTTRESQRSDYAPQRNSESNSGKTYQRIEQKPAPNPRDRYEAPPIQRSPSRTTQRNDDVRRQMQQRPVQRTRESMSNVRRESVQPSQRSTQFKKSDGATPQRRSEGRSGSRSDFKMRN